jgi:hypothetical protein
VKEKMLAVEAGVLEVVQLLEALLQETRDAQSRHYSAVQVLTRMAEALADAVRNLSPDVMAEAIELGEED